MMKSIILHWTGGTYLPNKVDARHYHYLIDGSGIVSPGVFDVEDNIPPLKRGKYAAHAARHNSHAIGVALCAMAGAQPEPFAVGKYPVRQVQVDALVDLCAELCRQYDIDVDAVRCHSELPNQAWKWDINWIPGMREPRGDTGERIRGMIRERLTPPSTWWQSLIEAILAAFRRT